MLAIAIIPVDLLNKASVALRAFLTASTLIISSSR